MVSITLSVPEQVKKKMTQFDEVNWSGFIRKCIVRKAQELEWKEELLKKLAKEQELITWSVRAQKHTRQERFAELKKKGLL